MGGGGGVGASSNGEKVNQMRTRTMLMAGVGISFVALVALPGASAAPYASAGATAEITDSYRNSIGELICDWGAGAWAQAGVEDLDLVYHLNYNAHVFVTEPMGAVTEVRDGQKAGQSTGAAGPDQIG